MINFQEHLTEYFVDNNILHEVLPDGVGLEACMPAAFGPTPFQFRMKNGFMASAKCFVPIRIKESDLVSVSELILRLNNILPAPRVGFDHSNRLAFASEVVSPIESISNESIFKLLVTDCVSLAHCLNDSIVRVVHKGALASEVIRRLKKIASERLKKQKITESLKIGGTTELTVNPQLN